jgi:hypothetical protein
VLVYNYDSDIYVSDEGRMLAEMGDSRFRMGSVHEPLATLQQSDAMKIIRRTGIAEQLPGWNTVAGESGLYATPSKAAGDDARRSALPFHPDHIFYSDRRHSVPVGREFHCHGSSAAQHQAAGGLGCVERRPAFLDVFATIVEDIKEGAKARTITPCRPSPELRGAGHVEPVPVLHGRPAIHRTFCQPSYP